MRCLVCGIENASKGRSCKLCGMKSEKPVRSNGFDFCCGSCASSFSKIIRQSARNKVSEIIESEIVI